MPVPFRATQYVKHIHKRMWAKSILRLHHRKLLRCRVETISDNAEKILL